MDYRDKLTSVIAELLPAVVERPKVSSRYQHITQEVTYCRDWQELGKVGKVRMVVSIVTNSPKKGSYTQGPMRARSSSALDIPR